MKTLEILNNGQKHNKLSFSGLTEKLLNTVWSNILVVLTLFLLAFIPLYPKLPLLDVPNTWVYIRAEDFVVAATLVIWIFFLLLKKVKLETPLTVPILIFWLVGAVSTLHGVLILFPRLANVFPNVALLSFFRKIEYMSLFFIGFSAIRNKKSIYYIISVLTITLLLIVLYGLGQRFLGFPAYLTGNEEFAKGAGVRVSELGRIPSTFAGHYDLAAYLVLVIPILVSLAFSVKNFFWKVSFFTVSILGFGLLFMTVSRVSLVAILVSLFILIVFYRQKIFIISLSVLVPVFLILSPSLLQRYQETLTKVDVLFDTKNEKVLGQVVKVRSDYFKDKTIFKTPNLEAKSPSVPAPSIAVSYQQLPPFIYLLLEPNVPTGEFLPQGTGYVNLPMSPVKEKVAVYVTEKRKETGAQKDEVKLHEGDFLVKTATAYDLSFTTRFQGEWPKAANAFLRNIFIGSGYSSVGLAVDNNYLRILAESGILGFGAFLLVFLTAAIYIAKTYPLLKSKFLQSFVFGFTAGSLGLILNGVFIDVFDASKVAFTYWLLMGIVLGALHFYTKSRINLFYTLRRTLMSPVALACYLLFFNILLFIPMYSNYFVGDDFTWLAWTSRGNNIIQFFIDSEGFFWRPGTKIYFMLMNSIFGFNQNAYHIVSIIIHSLSVLVLFVILDKIFKNRILATAGAFIFIIMTSFQEAVFWISAIGFLYTTLFALFSLLFYILWKEKNNKYFFVLSMVTVSLGFLFHELGVVVPFLLISYDLVFSREFRFTQLLKREYIVLFLPLIPYFFLRYISQSHWFSGDYSYNLVKFPLNALGNSLGYIALSFLGPQSIGFYSVLRNTLRDHILLSLVLSVGFLVFLYFSFRLFINKLEVFEKKLVLFGILFFFIALLPFLGLGNIAIRYGYMATLATAFILPVFIKKGYLYLRTIADIYTSYFLSAFLILSLLTFYLLQVQKTHLDWKSAGDVSRNFLVSLQGYYREAWTEGRWNLYFVDIPTKLGNAWIFPVGLSDAVALSFNHLNLNTYQASTLEEAFAKAPATRYSVFKFEQDGKLREYEKGADGKIREIKK